MNPLTIIIVVVVVILLIMLWRYIYIDPNMIQGLTNGQTFTVIPAASLSMNSSGVPINNFSYSIWFYVNDWNYRYGEPKVIFGRMTSSSDPNVSNLDMNSIQPCPAVVLGAVENSLSVSLNCFPGVDNNMSNTPPTSIVHTCSIGNVPIQKWVNLIISVYGRTMDMYIDGKLVKTCLLPGIANVNNNSNLYISPQGGFNGWTSKFQYFANPTNPQQAWNIYTQGYSNGMNLFSAYQLQISLINNGNTSGSITL